MSVKERIAEFCKVKNISQKKFEHIAGLSNGYINNIVNSISPKKLELISAAFPDLNKSWLLLGEGRMLHFTDAEEIGYPDGTEDLKIGKSGNEFIDTDKGNSFMLVPLVEYNVYGGYLSGWGDPHFLEDLPKHMISVDVYNKGVYRAFRVRGDSMNDGSLESIIEGDIITGRIIEKPLWYSKFHLHSYKYFIIVHKEGILVKNIKDHRVDDGRIIVSSLNRDKEMYPDQEIYLSDVYEMMNVVDLYRKTKFL
jgi:transcriptional regulator with XRE-family HTH domain